MKTIQLNLYPFVELKECAKETALNDNRFINVDTNWWEFIYEDAETAGLKIRGFDLDRAYYCNAEFKADAINCAGLIVDNHGENTETYQATMNFWTGRDGIVNTWPKDRNGEFENVGELDCALDRIEESFLQTISHEYLKMLLKEYEYLISDSRVSETLTIGEYPFTADGKIATDLEKLAQA